MKSWEVDASLDKEFLWIAKPTKVYIKTARNQHMRML